jgi:hypothetical protein
MDNASEKKVNQVKSVFVLRKTPGTAPVADRRVDARPQELGLFGHS